MPKPKGRETHPEGDKIPLTSDERARLKALRNKRGWSQAVLAVKAHTTQGTISNMESGRTQPYLSVYLRVVRVLEGKDVSPAASDSLHRMASKLPKLDDDNFAVVETLLDSLLKKQQPR